MTDGNSVVVLGGGHAGAQLCASLRALRYAGEIHLVCQEGCLPYHRPPLSKTFLANEEEELQLLRPAAWYAQSNVTIYAGNAAVAVDRSARVVELASGQRLPYSNVVFATGARPKVVNILDAAENVFVLRNHDNAVNARGVLKSARELTIIGGGFIGLEVAAMLQAAGKDVSLIEAAPRVLARSASARIAGYIAEVHRANGILLRTGAAIETFEVNDGRLQALKVDGEREPVEAAVLAIGSVAETELARQAGLRVSAGIEVNEYLQTSDENIFAIGDCALFPGGAGGHLQRLESVQNANDQARHVAAMLCAKLPRPYHCVPWFWSDQGDVRLQIAGLLPSASIEVFRRGACEQSFSLLHYVDDALKCVESINAPQDHMAARRLLEGNISPPPEEACLPAVPLIKRLKA